MESTRPEKRSAKSWLSQASSATRRVASGKEVMPLRISPKVRTLRSSRLSSVELIHLVRLGLGLALTSSEMMLASSRKPRLTV